MGATRSGSGPRLTRADWIEAAWAVLRDTAAAQPSVAEIAKRLGVTKGSFYWHFEDRADFRSAMFEFFHEEQTEFVMRAMRAVEGTPGQRLRALSSFLAEHLDASRERAVYQWAAHDAEIAAAVAEDQEQRIAYVAGMLRAGGWPPAKARARATIFVLLMSGWNLTRPAQRAAELRRYARQIEELFDD